jgi:hypothetical protein
MKNLGLILLAFLLVTPPLRAQLSDLPVSAIRSNRVLYTPLNLSINGKGEVLFFRDGELLPVGGKFVMWAAAAPGYVFVNWQPANVFIFTQVTIDGAGKPVSTTSAEWVPVPEYQWSSFLEFTPQLDNVIFDAPGVETISQGQGWIANFAPARH